MIVFTRQSEGLIFFPATKEMNLAEEVHAILEGRGDDSEHRKTILRARSQDRRVGETPDVCLYGL
ncbi:MAG: hypothetical protein AAB733_02045 [Patescibacteria group bacterium]